MAFGATMSADAYGLASMQSMLSPVPAPPRLSGLAMPRTPPKSATSYLWRAPPETVTRPHSATSRGSGSGGPARGRTSLDGRSLSGPGSETRSPREARSPRSAAFAMPPSAASPVLFTPAQPEGSSLRRLHVFSHDTSPAQSPAPRPASADRGSPRFAPTERRSSTPTDRDERDERRGSTGSAYPSVSPPEDVLPFRRPAAPSP